MKDLVKKLSEAFGPSGSEERIRSIIRSEVEQYADEVRVDAMGSLICRVAPKNPAPGVAPKRIMVDAHMDEIGIVVSHIDEKGFLRFRLWAQPTRAAGPEGGIRRRHGGRVRH